MLSCIRFFSLKRGGGAALRCYGGFLRLFLPLEKGELEGDEEMKAKNYKLKVENQKALILCGWNLEFKI